MKMKELLKTLKQSSFLDRYFKDTETDIDLKNFNKNIKEMKIHLSKTQKVQEKLKRRKDEILP